MAPRMGSIWEVGEREGGMLAAGPPSVLLLPAKPAAGPSALRLTSRSLLPWLAGWPPATLFSHGFLPSSSVIFLVCDAMHLGWVITANLTGTNVGTICWLCHVQYDVMITAGANQAFTNVVLALLDADDRAALFRCVSLLPGPLPGLWWAGAA